MPHFFSRLVDLILEQCETHKTSTLRAWLVPLAIVLLAFLASLGLSTSREDVCSTGLPTTLSCQGAPKLAPTGYAVTTGARNTSIPHVQRVAWPESHCRKKLCTSFWFQPHSMAQCSDHTNPCVLFVPSRLLLTPWCGTTKFKNCGENYRLLMSPVSLSANYLSYSQWQLHAGHRW